MKKEIEKSHILPKRIFSFYEENVKKEKKQILC